MSAPSKEDGAETNKLPADKTAVKVEAIAKPAPNATFTNTRQHVADRQRTSASTERFANTKQNIALISDLKNGPRFTLTKKESGHEDKSSDKAAPLAAEQPVPASSPTTEAVDQPAAVPRPEAGEGAVERTIATEPKTTAAEPAEIGKTEDDAKQQAPVSAAERPLGPLGVPPAAKPPDKVPIDSSKTFVGPNGTFYDEAWRWMDWRGVKRSWNWPAFLSFGHWFAYRRLYKYAGVVVVWLVSLAAALVNNLHVGLVAGLLILSLVLVGLYANTLYFLVFRRAVAHVTEEGEGSYDERRQQLAKAGGVNSKAPYGMAALTIVGIGLALGVTFFVRGALLINIWPF